MVLTIKSLHKNFGANVVLKDVGAVVDRQDKIGIIGENGAGKTTLIKVIIGELLPDAGEIVFAKGVNTGYLEQNSVLNAELTVYGEMQTVYAGATADIDTLKSVNKRLEQTPHDEQLLHMCDELTARIEASGVYEADIEIKKVLSGMAFPKEVYDKKVCVLSGGEHTRLCLAKLLLQRPDVLILDEPTNHLDFAAMEWLEEYLKGYNGAVLVISHDRYFLDAVCNRIFEVEGNELKTYKGNYSAYLPQKEAAAELALKQHEADVDKAAKLEEYIAKNIVRASTTKMAQSRRKQLEKLEITQKPMQRKNNIKLSFNFDVSPYKDVLSAKGLSIALGGKTLLKNLNLDVKREEKLVIAGANGTGKSTLLRILDGKLRPDTGTVKLGTGVKYSVFEQQQLRRGGTVISSIWDKHPKFTQIEVRNHLAKLSFTGEDVFKPCTALSGGELARLRFAEMLLEDANVLFMDEPTNHLDIYTRQTIGTALCDYKGTLIIVTHDRYLMNSLGCGILYLKDGGETELYGSYNELLSGIAQSERNAAVQKQPPTEQKAAYGKQQRQLKAQLRTKIKECEEELTALDGEIVQLEGKINDPEILKDFVRINEICEELDRKKLRHDEVFMMWEEAIEKQIELEDVAE